MTSAARVARRFIARQVPFHAERVDRIASDLQLFVQAAKQIQSKSEYDRVQEAARNWSKDVKELYDSLMRHLIQVIEGTIEDPKKQEKQIEASRKKVYSIYDSSASVSMIPDWENWAGARSYWIQGMTKAADSLPGTLAFLGTLKRKKIVPLVSERVEETLNLEGFRVRLVEYNPSEHESYLEAIKEALRVFRARASQVLPILLKKMLPLVIRFDTGGLNHTLAHYAGQYIQINPKSSMSTNPLVFAKTISHEMGHHLFGTVLSGAMQSFWKDSIARDVGFFDLNEVLAAWDPGEEWHSFFMKLRREDPVLYLQLEAADNFTRALPNSLRGDNFSRKNLEEYLSSGGNPKVKSPKTPITSYGASNAEEGFCEAVGMLVAYGTRALDPKVRSWLSVLFPEIKTASIQVN